MATLTTQTVTQAGIVGTFAAAAGGGDSFTPSNRTWLEIVNGSGGAITVTVVTTGTQGGQPVADIANSVGAGATEKMGPFPGSYFADSADGLADITYSGVTTLTVGVFALAEV